MSKEEKIHCFSKSRRLKLVNMISSVKFFSLLVEWSTDKGNISGEDILVVMCDHD